jgi:hypothetical protein
MRAPLGGARQECLQRFLRDGMREAEMVSMWHFELHR